MHVCQVIEVIVAVLQSSIHRSQCPPLTANALLYIAELCTSVRFHIIPLLPLFMPAVIEVTTDLALLTRFVAVAFLIAPTGFVPVISFYKLCYLAECPFVF